MIKINYKPCCDRCVNRHSYLDEDHQYTMYTMNTKIDTCAITNIGCTHEKVCTIYNAARVFKFQDDTVKIHYYMVQINHILDSDGYISVCQVLAITDRKYMYENDDDTIGWTDLTGFIVREVATAFSSLEIVTAPTKLNIKGEK